MIDDDPVLERVAAPTCRVDGCTGKATEGAVCMFHRFAPTAEATPLAVVTPVRRPQQPECPHCGKACKGDLGVRMHVAVVHPEHAPEKRDPSLRRVHVEDWRYPHEERAHARRVRGGREGPATLGGWRGVFTLERVLTPLARASWRPVGTASVSWLDTPHSVRGDAPASRLVVGASGSSCSGSPGDEDAVGGRHDGADAFGAVHDFAGLVLGEGAAGGECDGGFFGGDVLAVEAVRPYGEVVAGGWGLCLSHVNSKTWIAPGVNSYSEVFC